MFQSVIRNFIRGLLIIAPIAATAWLMYSLFTAIDGWLDLERILDRRVVPGAGVLATFLAISLVGALARLIGLRWIFHQLDVLLAKLPLVRILYTAMRDLTRAFVGDERRFGRPVAVAPTGDPNLVLLGFLTRDGLDEFGLPDFVSVYVPQSYNFSGQLVLVARDRVRAIPVEATQTMKFIISGGVADAGGAAGSSQEPASAA